MNSEKIIPLHEISEIETKTVLKAAALAHRALGELKGLALTIPNQNILLSTLSLQEAKESSEIENIVTTQDDLYQSNYPVKQFSTHSAKEVHSYANALTFGFEKVKESGLLTNNTIVEMQKIIEENNAGFRKQAGTSLVNNLTGEVIFTPPQSAEEVISLMTDLENFINNDELSDFDTLVKMALIHHRFETIHPFYDGNGRTGRIINVLFLTNKNILDTPILYLSRYINRNKSDYYRFLQEVRDTGSWENWLLFMMSALENTASHTSGVIRELVQLMKEYKAIIKEQLPKIYSHELINNLFKYPYTKIEYITEDLGLHRNTARKYLDQLIDIGLLERHKKGKENYYLNKRLFDLLTK
jgi:Fic family protein